MNDDDSFDAAFEEAAAELRGSEPSTPSGEPAPAPDGSTTTTAPAPAPASETVAPAAAPAQSPSSEASPPADASVESMKRTIEEISARERASAARASHNARENNLLRDQLTELNRRFEELAARVTAPAASAPAPASEPASDVLSAAPDLEAAVTRRVQEAISPLLKEVGTAKATAEAASRTVGEVRQVVDPIAEEQIRQTHAQTHAALDARFGQEWRKTVNDETFLAWLATEPDLQRNYETDPTFAGSAKVLGSFYAIHGFPQPATAPAPSQTTAPAAAAGNPQQRLRQAAGIVSRAAAAAAPAVPGPDDFEGNFALATAQLKRA